MGDSRTGESGHIGWTVLGIGVINILSDFRDRFALIEEPHHVTRDIHTDASAKRVAIENGLPICSAAGDIALIIILVPDRAAAAVAGNLLQDRRVCQSEAVGLLHAGRRCADFVRQA